MEVTETDSGSDFSDHLNSDLGAAGLKSWSTQTLNDEVSVEILDAGRIVEVMKETVSEIAEIINEDYTVTRILLAHFRWEKQALLER